DTIAGWCLRLATSYPSMAGLLLGHGPLDWGAVYDATARLINTGSIDRVIKSSYVGVLVDEYQDCTIDQHNVIRVLADRIPVCVFGDPLQSVFNFAHQPVVDWDRDVIPHFP